MFSNRPLTWLFVIATLCLDGMMLFGGTSATVDQLNSFEFMLFNFLVPSQLSALAIWAVLGEGHRLTRAAVLTSATAVLTFAVWRELAQEVQGLVVADFVVQVLAVTLVASGFWQLGWVSRLTTIAGAQDTRLRIALVEFFGWTIVVALWAFMLRYAVFETTLFDRQWWLWAVCSIVPPVMVLPLLFGQLPPGTRILRLMALYLLVLLAYAVTRFTLNQQGPLPMWAFVLCVTQITYLAAWWAVMRMDRVMVERRRVTAASRKELAHFDPLNEKR